jgi:hypothetical protein
LIILPNTGLLPVNAFTNGQNVRFLDGKVQKFLGHQQVFGTNPITPYYSLPFANNVAYYWIVCGATKVYITDMTNWTNITRQSGGIDQDYSAGLDINWNGGVLGGSIPILNNGVDSPQQWYPAQSSQRLANLKYDASRTWADVSYTAKIMRTFKNYIIAMDVTKSGTQYNNLVKWSASADPGSIPDTWDESDATYDAGESVVTEAGGNLIDGAALRDNFIIYAEDATHIMSYIGGNYVFRFGRLFDDGILSRRCVKPVKGFHVVLAANDLVMHDGSNTKSIIDKKMRSWLFNNIDPDNYERCFVTPNYRKNEMWVCFPQVGSTLPDMALVWNYEDSTFGIREIPNTPHIAYGVIDPGTSNIWDDQTTTTWDNANYIWDVRTYNPTVYYPLMLGTNLYQGDYTEQFAGTSMTSYVERTGLDFGAPDAVKHISRVIPKMTGSGAVTISLGSQDYPDDSITWKNYTFTPGTDWKIDTRISGKFIGYKISSTGNIHWDASSFEFEVTTAGGR